MSKRALLVIDLQNDYFPGGKWELSGIESAASNAAALIDGARKAGDLVVHVRHEFPMEEAPFFVAGSEGAQHHASVRPADGEIEILKHQVNAFQDTNLKATLDTENVKQITVCGAMSHMCVDAATRAAADFGYEVTVIHDACASRDLEFGNTTVPAEQAHAAYMSSLGFAYANLVSTKDYLAGA